MEQAIWLVPLLPFAGFLANTAIAAFARGRSPKVLHSVIACGAVAGSAIVAWMAFLHVVSSHHPIVSAGIPWINIPGMGEDGSFMRVLAEHRLVVDQLSAVMILVVTNVGFLIHLYSTGYMADEKRYARYFSYLNLFTGFMLILVMGSNLLLMFVGWEGVGLCSYLLIGFWFEKAENAAAGMKAFVVNRIGDFGFTIGVLLLFTYLGTYFHVWTVDFREIGAVIEQNKGAISGAMMTWVGILLFVGATGKSAQLPLYVWLPDAMAGPTPVSALIHAATMVTAGVYMIARMNFVFSLAPWAMTVVAVVGGLTALFAGTIGVAQNDIKKVLAYSTVSQLGFMFMGVGVGAYAAGIFHLMTHAFFKACLFLGSGSVIHGMGGEQDIRKMGGLKKYMPITFITFAVASLAISGFPLLAGFWSKDEILWKAFSSHLPIPGFVIWGMGIIAAAFTAFYMTRLVVLTFLGEPRFEKPAEAHGHGHDAHDAHDASPSAAHAATGDKHDAHDAHGGGHGHHGTPHESPPSMTIPLIVLAILSVFGGFVGMGAWTHMPNWFEHWLEPVFGGGHGGGHHEVPPMEYVMVAVSVIVGLGGIFFGLKVYLWGKGRSAEQFATDHREVYELVRDKYRVDEMYKAAVVEPLLDLNEVLGRTDNVVIDGAVNKSASITASASTGTGFFDNEVVDGGVNAAAKATQAAARSARRLQTGHIRQYLSTALVGGLLVIGAFALWTYRDAFKAYLGL